MKTSGPNPPVRTESGRVAIAASVTSGQILAIPCPFPQGCLLRRAHLDIRVQSSAACTLDIGKAANATTSADNLLDGISIAATGLKDSTNDTDNGTNGSAATVLWSPSEFVTVTVASGNANGATIAVLLEVIPRV